MKADPSVESPPAPASLFDRFQVAFNQIDAAMRKETGRNRIDGFATVLRDFEKKGSLGSDGDFLRSAAELRNVLIHNKTLLHCEMAVPTEPVVQRLERLNERIQCPPRIYPMFRSNVVCIAPEDSLVHVMRLVVDRKFSQFPVMEGGRFVGLLTENGITRWLARKIVNSLSLVEFEDAKVSDLIHEEELRANSLFVSKDTALAEVRERFRENGFLEAVLITHNGRKTKKLLGLMNRWDLVRSYPSPSVADGYHNA